LESLYVPVPQICNEDAGTKRDPEISDNHSSASKLPIPRDPVQRILKVNELERICDHLRQYPKQSRRYQGTFCLSVLIHILPWVR
jgi:hypothetical protein